MQPLAIESILRILGRGAWFSRQPAYLRRLLVEHGKVVSFPKGAWIFGASEEADGLFAVLDGSLFGYATLSRSETVLVEFAGPGAWFGQVSLLRNPQRLVTAMAATPVQLLLVPRRELHRLTGDYPALWESFAELSQLQMQRLLTTLAEMLALPSRSRVAARLAALVPRSVRKSSLTVKLRLTQTDLAEMTGLERKAVHRILKGFEKKRLIAIEYGAVRILDRRGLEKIRDERKT